MTESYRETKMCEYVLEHAKKGDNADCIKHIDEFCWANNWMMNIGDEKGDIYEKTIKDNGVNLVLEIGMYCGYSALRALQSDKDLKIISVDPSEWTNNIAKKIFTHAGVQDRVTILCGSLNDKKIIDELKKYSFDLILIDHEKDIYLRDLQLLESNSIVRKNTIICADNVLFFKLNVFIGYVKTSGKYDDVVIHKTCLEYRSGGKKYIKVYKSQRLLHTFIVLFTLQMTK